MNQDPALKKALARLKKLADQNHTLEAHDHPRIPGCCTLKSPQGGGGQQDGVTEDDCISAAKDNGMQHTWKPGNCN